MNKNVTLDLSNNQAVHLWGMMASYIHDTGNDLKRRGIYKSDGTLKKSRKYFSDFEQEILDNITLAELILKDLENKVDFSEITNSLKESSDGKN